MNIIKFWKPIIIAIIIFYGSITSSSDLNKVNFLNFDYADKLIHFLLYFTLSISFLASLLKNTKYNRISLFIITFIFSTSYGIIMEMLQFYFTSYRSPEIMDAIANSIGGITGIFILLLLEKSRIYKYL